MFKLKSTNLKKVKNFTKVFPRIRKNAKIYFTSMDVLFSAWKKGVISYEEYNSYTAVYGFSTSINIDGSRIGVVKTSSLVK